jgi:hypothetical protein
LPNLSAQFERADSGKQGFFQKEFSTEPEALEYVLASRKAAVEAGIERDCGESIVAKVHIVMTSTQYLKREKGER